MKDAYSLDPSEESLDAFYPSMYQAYLNVFERCSLKTIPIEADVGAMGGKSSHEFTVPHDQGEDTYISCTNCDYAANVEAAQFVREGERPAELAPLTKVATPGCKTIDCPTPSAAAFCARRPRPRYEPSARCRAMRPASACKPPAVWTSRG
jgi:prolyl-tRNA synthetase